MRVIYIFSIFLIVFTAIILLIRSIESRLIFFPMKGKPAASDMSIPHEEVWLKAADGTKLHAWFVPRAGRLTVPDPSPLVLFLHGNAGNMGHRWDKIRILHELGTAVFIFDYRGYGLSEGRPSEAGIHKDVAAALAHLIQRGVDPASVIVYGESIGGGFAVNLAAKKSVGALILEDTFTSIPAMVRRSMPFIPSFVLTTRLDSLSGIRRVSAPKLVFHSVDDEIVPFEMGEALFRAASEPKRFVRLRGGHNTAFFDDLQTYRAELSGFIRSIPPPAKR